MTFTTLGMALIVAQSAVGCHWGPKHVAKAGGDCRECVAVGPSLSSTLIVLQKSPKWRDRDRAAQLLRQVDWRARPEVVGALAFTLLNDPHGEVREEAAESLARMRPCLPGAREALRIAAARDRDFGARKWARRGLAALPPACELPCDACGPVEGVVVTGPGVLPGAVTAEPLMTTEPFVAEPRELPPPPPQPLGRGVVEPPFDTIPEPLRDSTVPPLPPSGGLEPLPPPVGDVSRRPPGVRAVAPRVVVSWPRPGVVPAPRFGR